MRSTKTNRNGLVWTAWTYLQRDEEADGKTKQSAEKKKQHIEKMKRSSAQGKKVPAKHCKMIQKKL